MKADVAWIIRSKQLSFSSVPKEKKETKEKKRHHNLPILRKAIVPFIFFGYIPQVYMHGYSKKKLFSFNQRELVKERKRERGRAIIIHPYENFPHVLFNNLH